MWASPWYPSPCAAFVLLGRCLLQFCLFARPSSYVAVSLHGRLLAWTSPVSLCGHLLGGWLLSPCAAVVLCGHLLAQPFSCWPAPVSLFGHHLTRPSSCAISCFCAAIVLHSRFLHGLLLSPCAAIFLVAGSHFLVRPSSCATLVLCGHLLARPFSWWPAPISLCGHHLTRPSSCTILSFCAAIVLCSRFLAWPSPVSLPGHLPSPCTAFSLVSSSSLRARPSSISLAFRPPSPKEVLHKSHANYFSLL